MMSSTRSGLLSDSLTPSRLPLELIALFSRSQGWSTALFSQIQERRTRTFASPRGAAVWAASPHRALRPQPEDEEIPGHCEQKRKETRDGCFGQIATHMCTKIKWVI